MRFLGRRVQYFKGLGTPFSLTYEPGITIVEGENRDSGGVATSNGVGKSLQIVETFLYALFGRMARHGNKAVNHEACHTFNGADVTEIVELKKNYVVHIQRSRTVLGRPRFTVKLPSGEMAPISRDPNRRTEDVSGILGLDYVATRAAVVMTRGGSLASAGFSEQMAVLEGILRLDELNDAAQLKAKEAAEIMVGYRAAEATCVTMQRTFENSKQLLEELQRVATFDFDEAIEHLDEQITEAEDAAEDAAKMVPVLQSYRNGAIQAQDSYNALFTKSAGLNHELQQKYNTVIDTACPQCLRPFKDAKEREAQKKALAAETRALQHQAEEAGRRAEAQQAVLMRTQETVTAQERQYSRLIGIASRKPEYESQREQILQQQAVQEHQLKSAQRSVEQAEVDLAAAVAQVKVIGGRQFRAAWWAREFGRDGLQAQIFAQAQPVLNHWAAEYSRRLLSGITVAFNTLRDKRTEDLIRINDGELAYESLSDGEKERCNLVIAFSLRALARWRLPEPINLLILDEVFSSVDPAGTQAILSLLHDEVKSGISVFVITHDAKQKELFPGAKTIQVVRENGEATVLV